MRRAYERRLEALQVTYREKLLSALQKCAKGEWGLFGQNDEPMKQVGRFAQREYGLNAAELLELGGEIELLRSKIGYPDAFTLHAQLLVKRKMRGANTPGEPKLAQQWLDELRA